MHGLTLLFLKGRERTSAFLAAIILFVFAGATAGEPHREVVDGRTVVEPVIFGHIVPTWLFFVAFAPIFIGLWYGIHRLINRLWPEREKMVVDRVYPREGGGFVAWKGDDPDAGSPLDYAAPRLRTPLDYLQAEEPAPMRVLMLGAEAAQEESEAYYEELNRWLREASEGDLQRLTPAYETMPTRSADAAWRLIEAHEDRGVPTRSDLSALAEATHDETLVQYLAESP